MLDLRPRRRVLIKDARFRTLLHYPRSRCFNCHCGPSLLKHFCIFNCFLIIKRVLNIVKKYDKDALEVPRFSGYDYDKSVYKLFSRRYIFNYFWLNGYCAVLLRSKFPGKNRRSVKQKQKCWSPGPRADKFYIFNISLRDS